MLAQTLLILVFGPVNGFSIIYAGKLGIGMDKYGLYIAITYACSFTLSYFLGMLADRYNPLRTGGVCLGLYATLMISSWFLLRNSATFGPVLILHSGAVCPVCFCNRHCRIRCKYAADSCHRETAGSAQQQLPLSLPDRRSAGTERSRGSVVAFARLCALRRR